MTANLDKLKAIAVDRNETAKARAQWRKENRERLRISQDIALCLHHYLRTNKMSQKEFAERMGVSPAYVGKLLKGCENLTIETICKIQRLMGDQLISVACPNTLYQTCELLNDASKKIEPKLLKVVSFQLVSCIQMVLFQQIRSSLKHECYDEPTNTL